MLKKKWKKAWVAALRSGKYRQTKYALSSPKGNAMCCLGVLCDVVDPTGWGKVQVIRTQGGRKRVRAYAISREANALVPPLVIRDQIMADYSYLPVGRLADLNDEQGKSFAEIADWIEENL